jgi:hypothetical protein
VSAVSTGHAVSMTFKMNLNCSHTPSFCSHTTL